MTIRAAVLCDETGCDAVFATTERLARYELISEAHNDGWASTLSNGRWRNHCPDHDNK